VNVAAELDFVQRRVERLELVNAALSAQHFLPQVVNLAAERSDGTNPSDDDASFHSKRGAGGRERG
jgi:hypothetical protein